MIWERHGEFDTLVIEGDVVGNVFPFSNGFAAAMQHDYMKTCRTRERGRLYVERRATEHHRKMCLKAHKEDPQSGPIYNACLEDFRERERAADTRSAVIQSIPF